MQPAGLLGKKGPWQSNNSCTRQFGSNKCLATRRTQKRMKKKKEKKEEKKKKKM